MPIVLRRKCGRKIEEDALEAVRAGRKRYVALDGLRNPHPGYVKEGVRYFSLDDFPHYFDLDQLYDLNEDVFEQHNLAGDPSYRSFTKEMQDRLRALLAPLPHTFGIQDRLITRPCKRVIPGDPRSRHR